MNWKKEGKWVNIGESFLPLLSMALIFQFLYQILPTWLETIYEV